ncbi:MAG TPA: VIT1/CCC1 transporter family protein [Capsulimonadaceae bacterium]|jgi:VIT1/CCC1 family predicted Fe2+/Mn2+ transporter/rubrerythrin
MTNTPPSKQTNAELVRILTLNWNEETEGTLTYRALAEMEPDRERKAILNELADAEALHASLWEKRILELGGAMPVYKGPPTGRAKRFANVMGGPNSALRRIEIDEAHDIARYAKQLKEIGDEPSIAILNRAMRDEQEHAKLLRKLTGVESAYKPHKILTGKPLDPQEELDELRKKRNRKSPAGWIGDAIYGVNDGLGAIFGIVSGVSGATAGASHLVLIAGIAGGVASALSMGAGAYLAAKSEREIYEAALYRKREDLMTDPEGGKRELSLIYQTKGIPEADAETMASHLSKDPEQFLRSLAAEELNLTEDALSNPIVSAISGALSTAVGAFIPIIPFFFMQGVPAIIAAAVISLIAHFLVGAAKTWITVRPWWASGLEMTLVGAVEGVVTYMIGIGLSHMGGGGGL